MSRKSFSSGLSIKPLLLQGNSPLPKNEDINRRHAELDRINGSLTANASDVDSEDEREEGAANSATERVFGGVEMRS